MFNGLSKRSPWVAFALVVGILSMAGIPISAGFDAKFYLFSFAWQYSPWLVGVGLLGSAISIGYYFKFIKHAFLVKDSNKGVHVTVYSDQVLMQVIAAVLLLAGALPWVLLKWVF
jgi:NADH-quinone oxidoreductase subunit N